MSRTSIAKVTQSSTDSIPVHVEQKGARKAVDAALKRKGLDMDTSWFARARRRKVEMFQKANGKATNPDPKKL